MGSHIERIETAKVAIDNVSRDLSVGEDIIIASLEELIEYIQVTVNIVRR